MNPCKTITAVLLCMALGVGLLGGCAPGGAGSGGSAPAQPAGSASQPAPAPESGTGEPVKLTYWLVENVIDESKKEYVMDQMFREQYPNIDIELVPVAENTNDYNIKIQMAVATNTLPDMYDQNFQSCGDYIKAGVITDLTDYFDAIPGFYDRFRDGAFDGVRSQSPDGRTYGMPIRTECQGWYYNKKIFDACGLEIPETFDELLHCVEVLRANGITPMAHGAVDIASVWGYYVFWFRYGIEDELEDLKSGALPFTESTSFLRSFERMQELAQAGMFPDNVATMNQTQAFEMFLAGQSAMWQYPNHGAPNIATSEIADDVVFNWGPTFSDGVGNQNRGCKVFGWQIFVGSAAGKDPAKMDAIMKYLQFRTSPEITSMLFKDYGYLPATKLSDTDMEGLPSIYNKIFEAFSDDAVPTYEVPALFDDTFKVPYRNALTGVITGTTTPQEACAQVQEWYETSWAPNHGN